MPPAIPWRLLGVLAVAAGAFWAGHQWHAGRTAQADLERANALAEQLRLVRQAADATAARHAVRVRAINQQLGAAHAQIATLAGRDCLDPDTVRVLNDLAPGGDVRAPAGQPADPATTPAADRGHGQPGADPAGAGTGIRRSTDRDVAQALALCRARYAEVAGQLDSILDIEDRRHGPGP